MKLSEIFTKAREILDSPEKWTRGVFARDLSGRPTTIEEGCSFCVLGAVLSAKGIRDSSDGLIYETEAGLLRKVIRKLKNRPIFVDEYNDDPDTTYEDVIILLDAAIELARKEEESHVS